MSNEYRVRWRREGHERVTRIFQTRQAAERKARGILALEEIKCKTTMSEMDNLVEQPTIEAREVGEWLPGPPTPEPTDKDRDGMRMYFMPDDGYSGIF